MKLLFFTDLHITTNRPSSRKDDYIETISSKLDEMVSVSEEVDWVILGGDIFHRAKPNIEELSVFVNFISKVNEKGCKVITCPGNHDLIGYNYSKIKRTGIGFCDSLMKEKMILMSDNNTQMELGENIWLHFRPSSNKVQDNFMVQRLDGINLGLMHDMLVEKPFFDDYVLIDDFTTNLDAVFNGHYHPGHPPTLANGTFYINPGAMIRNTKKKSDIQRLPKYAIIYIYDETKDKDFVVSYFPFQSYNADVFVEDIQEEIKPFFENIEVKDPIGISAMDYIKIRANDFDLSSDARQALREIEAQVLDN